MESGVLHVSGIAALDRTLTAAWLREEVALYTRADNLAVSRALALAVRGRQKTDLSMQQRLRALRAVVFSRDRDECVPCGFGKLDTARPRLALAFHGCLAPERPSNVLTICQRCVTRARKISLVDIAVLQRFWRPGLARIVQTC